jgi:hypothetical protein
MSKAGKPEECHRRRPREHPGHGLGAASKRNADKVGTALAIEFIEEYPLRNGRSHIGQRLGFGTRQRGELVQGLHIERGIHDHGGRGEKEIGDRHKILFRVIGQRLEQEHVVGERFAREHAKRMAVGRRFRAGAPADHEVSPGMRLDHDRLPPAAGELLTQRAQEDVGSTAGAHGGDDPDRAAWISVRREGDALVRR